MKFKKPSVLLSILSLGIASLSADTFYLSDGSVLKGYIIRETKTSYTLRAETSRNVYGEKTILKLDVNRHEKEHPSVKAFTKLSGILPTPDLMPASTYASIIDNKVKPFIRKYPNSEQIEDAKEILETLEAEQAIILAGGTKLDGILISHKGVTADKYEISADKDLKKFIKFTQKKQYRPALSTLNQMEVLYPNSTQVRKAQKLALTILPFYEKELKVALSEVDEITMRRKRSLGSMTDSDRKRTEEIFKNQELQYQNRLATIKAAKGSTKWLPINPFNKGPIQANLNIIPLEISRISKEYKNPPAMAGALYRSTLKALEEGNIPKALELHAQFKAENPSAMFANSLEIAVNKQKEIFDALMKKKAEEERMAEKKKAEEEKMAKQKATEAQQASNNKSKGKLIDNVTGSKNRQLEDSLRQ